MKKCIPTKIFQVDNLQKGRYPEIRMKELSCWIAKGKNLLNNALPSTRIDVGQSKFSKMSQLNIFNDIIN